MEFSDGSIIFNVHLPRIGGAFLIGVALTTADAAYHGMFQNPLVSPDILGASAGAGFGAAFTIHTDQPLIMIVVCAFFGAIATVQLPTASTTWQRAVRRYHWFLVAF